MKLERLLIVVLVLSFISFNKTQAQTIRDYKKAAKKQLAKGDSVAALGIYRKAFENTDKLLDAKARYKMAEVADALRYYTISKRQYDFLLKHEQEDKFKDLRLKLANAQLNTGVYGIAIKNYERIVASSTDSSLIKKAIAGIEDAGWSLSRSSRMDSVEVVQLGEVVNTNNSEFAIAQNDQYVFFSRLELRDYKDKNAGTQTNVFRVDLELKDTTAQKVVIDQTAHHIANLTFKDDNKTTYFTVCQNTTITEYQCDIYTGIMTSNGELTAVKKLSSKINAEGYTQTNPSIGKDLNTGEDLLFFSSDRKGGKGGMDVYLAKGNNNNFGTPINISEVNTTGDEVTPFFHTPSQALFFSSKNHKTLGAFDVQRIQYSKEGWGEVEGLRSPINSTFDDTYYVLLDSPARTFFSSNRPGTTCNLNEIQECCGFDLYSIGIYVELEALTFNSLDSTDLIETNIVLLDKEGNRISEFTGDSNLKNFPLSLNKEYTLIATKPGYTSDTLAFDTKGIYQPFLMSKKMFLKPDLSLEIVVLDEETNKPLKGVTPVVLVNNAGVQSKTVNSELATYVYDIKQGDNYMADASLAGYTVRKTSGTIDAKKRTSSVIRDTVYLSPNTDVSLALYFDNDYPNPRSTDSVTNVTYLETVQPYLRRKSTFLKKSIDIQNSHSTQQIEQFFTEIEQNNRALIQFSNNLVTYLQQGIEMDLEISGFASPLAMDGYNKKLSSRRVRSIMNHLIQWSNGAILPYFSTGQLKIIQSPFGEVNAPKEISDNPMKRAYSEYGLKASRERKVIIKQRKRIASNSTKNTPTHKEQ